MGIIVFLGDSITDAGRMTSDNPLGDGYVSEFAAYITGTDPNWRVLNKGVDCLLYTSMEHFTITQHIVIDAQFLLTYIKTITCQSSQYKKLFFGIKKYK